MPINKIKYNLTFWQRLELPFLYLIWLTYPYADGVENVDQRMANRKSWHMVKKGMEKHEHNFVVPKYEHYKGKVYKFLQCDHEGCNLCDPVD